MLVPTETGFLEIVKEPQLKDIYTVQATDLVPRLGLSPLALD
jgi:hypothetical protein